MQKQKTIRFFPTKMPAAAGFQALSINYLFGGSVKLPLYLLIKI
jgi:hypothetical protein